MDLDIVINIDIESINDYYIYNGYLYYYETYPSLVFKFKLLLKLYLKGMSVPNYQGKYYTYDQFKDIYDITSFEHSKFCNDNFFFNNKNIEDTLKDVIDFNPNVIGITCECIEVQDPGDAAPSLRRLFTWSASELKFNL